MEARPLRIELLPDVIGLLLSLDWLQLILCFLSFSLKALLLDILAISTPIFVYVEAFYLDSCLENLVARPDYFCFSSLINGDVSYFSF